MIFKRTKILAYLFLSAVLSAGPSAWALDPGELPTEGEIVSGEGSFDASQSQMTVHQHTDSMIAEWSSFNIGEDASVTFRQPSSSSTALNRISDANPSRISGQLSANGKIFLLNTNGIIFGPSARVNVGGLVASSLEISNEDFLGGNYAFENSGSAGSIHSAADITADDYGYVVFISPDIHNTGSISAPSGAVALAAGDKVSLDFHGDRLINFNVDAGAVESMIENGGVIQASGGLVVMKAEAAGALKESVINTSGIVEAQSMRQHQGRIVLDAGQYGQSTVSGTLDVSSETAQAGRITVTGNKVLIDEGAQLSAAGETGGGEIFIGGGWQGKDPDIRQALAVTVAPTAVLDASAVNNGDGGTIVAWSDIYNPDSATRAYGDFLARGGINGGDGGRIETSGRWLQVTGVSGGARAPMGEPGQWLFDPRNVTITTAEANGSFDSGTWTPSGNDSTILNTDINTLLEGGTSVTVTTGNDGTQNGDITVSSTVTKGSGDTDVTFTLQAAKTISVDQAISNTGGTGKLNVALLADNDNGTHDGDGIILLNADITTNGGYIHFGDGSTDSINGVNTLVGGDVYVAGTGARTISTNGGAVNVQGEMIVANTDGFTINTNGGNVRFYGLLNSGNSYTYETSDGGAPWDADKISWENALSDAQSGGGGSVGDAYLATITSRLENAIAGRTANYAASWLGARRKLGLGTDAVWRWVAGPEGLEDSGRGRQFFIQSDSGGGTAIDDAYTNWNTSEPNNYDGTVQPVAGSENESALQFTSNNGVWNDLNYTDTTLDGYVKETNLAASGVTVDAGEGTVTFSGEVGGTKALDILNITAGTIDIDGGAVTTEGLQTYTGNVTLGAADTTLTQTTADTDFTLQSSKSIINDYGTDAGLTIKTTRDIIMEGSSEISSATGALDVVLHGDSDADGGAIFIKPGASISSNGGDITLSGGLDVSTGYAFGRDSQAGLSNGILIAGSSITSGGGNIIMRGKGAAVPGDMSAAGLHADFLGNNASGIYIANNGATNAAVNSGTGTISLTGTGIATDLGDSSYAHGIQIGASSSGSTTVTSANTTSTAITVTGDAGTATGSASATDGAIGIQLYTNSDVSATGTGGGIVIDGTGGDNADLQWAWGYNSAADSALSAEGLISITGTGQGGSNREDISLAGGTIGDASHSGGITLNMDTLDSSFGTTLSNAGALTVKPRSTGTSIGLGAGTGTLSLPNTLFTTYFSNGFSSITVGRADGTGDIEASTVTFSDPLTLVSGAGADATLIGAIADAGTGTSSGSLTVEVGRHVILNANGSITTRDQAVVLNADSDASGGGGVYLDDASSITSNGGAVTLAGGADAAGYAVGTGSLSSNVSTWSQGFTNRTYGVGLNNATLNSGAGAITIRGQGTASGERADGVSMKDGSITSTSGLITVDAAARGTDGWSTYGLEINDADLTTGDGGINMTGTVSDNDGNGVMIHSNSIIESTGSGAVTIEGTGGLNDWSRGVIVDTGTNIQTSGSGAITITGTGLGGTGSLGKEGVKISDGVTAANVTSTGTAAATITITGTADDGDNNGVWLSKGGVTSSNAAITVTGTGAGSGYGIEASNDFSVGGATDTGDITFISNSLNLSADTRLQSTGALTVKPNTDNTSIGIAGGAGTLALTADNFSTNFVDGFSGITIGSATAGAITIGATTTLNDSTTFHNNSTIDINGTVTANENLIFQSNGAITQTEAVTVTGTTSLTAGTNEVTLMNTGNDFTGEVSVVSAGNIRLIDSSAMTLGALSSTGTVDAATLNGDLTLTGAIETTNAGDSAVTLNAGKNSASGTSTGGNIIISGGSVSVGDGGRGTLYSGDVSDSTGLTDLVGSGSGNFRYNSDEADSNFTDALGAGTYAVYREQPVLSVAPEASTITYGDAVSFTPAYTGYANGDASPGTVTGTAVWTVGGSQSTSGNYTADMHEVTFSSGLTSSLGYGFTDNAASTNELTVDPYALTLSGFTADNKTYDGTTSVTGTGFSDDRIGGDDLSFDYAAAFANKNAGTDKTVNYTGITISGGTDQGNYALASAAGSAMADITKAGLTITARDDSKTYDGLAYSGGNGVTYSGFASGEDQNMLGGALDYSGTSQGAIQVGDYTIIPQGFSSDNYSITFTQGALEITVDTNDQEIDEVVRSLTSITKSVNGTQDSLSGTQSVPSNNFSIGPGAGSRSIQAFTVFELIKDRTL